MGIAEIKDARIRKPLTLIAAPPLVLLYMAFALADKVLVGDVDIGREFHGLKNAIVRAWKGLP